MYKSYKERRGTFQSLAAFAMLHNQVKDQSAETDQQTVPGTPRPSTSNSDAEENTDESDSDSDSSYGSEFFSDHFSELDDQDEQWLIEYLEVRHHNQDDPNDVKDQSNNKHTGDTEEGDEEGNTTELHHDDKDDEEEDTDDSDDSEINREVKEEKKLQGDVKIEQEVNRDVQREKTDLHQEKHQGEKKEEKSKTIEKEPVDEDIKRFLRLLASQLSDDTLSDMQALQVVFTVLAQLICQASEQQRAVIAGMMAKLGYPDFILNKLRLTLYLETTGTSSTGLISDVTLACMGILWNCCDVQQEFAQELAEEGGIRFMTNILKSDKCYGATNYQFRKEVKRRALHVLYNMSRYVNLIPKFKMANTSQAVVKCVKLENRPDVSDPEDRPHEQMLEKNKDAASNEGMQNIGQASVGAEVMLDGEEDIMVACLMLAYLADETNDKEGKDSQEDKTSAIDYTGTVTSIVQCLTNAQKSSEGRFRGFSTLELTQGLTKLAVSNRNATQIVKDTPDILGVLLELLQHEDPTLKAASAECLWNLAFTDEARKAIAGNGALVKALESLSKDSDDKDVTKKAQGALWVIKGNNASPEVINKEFEYDVFISYAWEDKELVRQIHDSLRAKQYKIWIDNDCMSNDLLQSMSEAVEKSAVVFICMSESYKHSVACRTEAAYTFKCLKEFIPLMMQSRYKPTEWLGALLGTRLFFDFGGKYPYEKKFKELVTELDKKLTSLSGQTAGVPRVGSNLRPITPGDDPITKLSREDVQRLLKSKGLKQQPLLDEIDGELLKQLKIIRDHDYYKFPKLMKVEYGMDLNDVLKLCAALETLKK